MGHPQMVLITHNERITMSRYYHLRLRLITFSNGSIFRYVCVRHTDTIYSIFCVMNIWIGFECIDAHEKHVQRDGYCNIIRHASYVQNATKCETFHRTFHSNNATHCNGAQMHKHWRIQMINKTQLFPSLKLPYLGADFSTCWSIQLTIFVWIFVLHWIHIFFIWYKCTDVSSHMV